MKLKAFTLAELLIALAILGVIATFTIPKVLTASNDSQKKAVTKEAAGLLSDAYQAYKKDNTPTATFYPESLIPYINYVSLMTNSELIDSSVGSGSMTCTSVSMCVKLHNGGVIHFYHASFGGTGNLDAARIFFDPDGTYSGQTTGSGKGLMLWLYYNGRITTYGGITPGTAGDSPCPSCDPSWFSWN